ncbi:pre-peptidase C-terminal domain-containing protein [Phormidium sp. LEGE 05292]|uniref:pre-peptidase C-terminal domain-containing protein n=1 Tax=[Phormidium] sp. LEGE 05292 TaxID=767427 RepID=UPI00187E6E8D|nr:pre-peptidase C-terminal domain-containing protein [Phormidium sp. LEGE 05292]MBE9228097.1 pre-peptidase C-terminal domain-containing protein [Phormidium sp. LEGE 05292]
MFDSDSTNSFPQSFSPFTNSGLHLQPTDEFSPKLLNKQLSSPHILGEISQEVIDTKTVLLSDNSSFTRLCASPLGQESDSLKTNKSSVDELTGEVLSNSNHRILEQALQFAQNNLKGLAKDADFNAKMNLAFGNDWNAEVFSNLVQEFAKGNFSQLPAIEIVPSAAINGANGAFASVTNTIYLAKEFVEQNVGNPGAITSVLLEETGHFIDSKINVSDAAGDEGDIFARVVEGKAISTDELLKLKVEDDTAVITLDGKAILIEQDNSLSAARNIGTLNGTQNFSDFVGTSDTNDYYRFSLSNNSNFSLTLNGLSADADVQLLDSNGNQIQTSALGGITAESITRTLNAGDYYVRVYPWGSGNTNYNLSLSAQSQITANRWRAEYFNNINLTGNPTFVEDLGDGSQAFSRNWGNGSPTNTPSDNFSAKMTTQRYLAPGLYKITTQADDGIRVRIGNQTVVNRWVDQPYTTNSGYFYSNGGNFPVAVEYYERGGGAAINFNITPATKFQDSVNESQEWKATVYSWDGSQGSAPPIDFWPSDINNSKAIGVINLGSNTRSDGKKGINVNWGNGAPNGDGNRLPHDYFAIRAYTWADFDGSPYKFRVMGDDGFQILATNQATRQTYYITPQNSWDQAYGPQKEITYTLPAGRYDLHFHQYEAGGDAYLNLSWEKVFDIKPVFDSNLRSSAQNVINDAVNTWESIIKSGPIGSPVKDGFQVRIYESNLSGYAGSSYAQNGYAEMDLTKSFFNLSYAQQKKVIMHELAHAMGFGQINSSDYWRNTTKIGSSYYFTGSNAKTLYGGNVPLMPNFNGAGSGWEHFRENDSKLRYDLMSAETNESYSSNDLKYTIAAFKDMGFNVA